MVNNRVSLSSANSQRGSQPSGSGAKKAGAAKPPSQERASSSGAGLKRTDSLPARLPSPPLPRTEVQPVREPITRAHPDTVPPRNFSEPPLKQTKLFGIPLRTKKQVEQMNELRIQEGAERKAKAFAGVIDSTGYKPDAGTKDEYMDVIRAYHPGYDAYSPEMQSDARNQMLQNNPLILAKVGETRNKVSQLPNGPTASRTMHPEEQVFLTHAIRELQEDFKKHPFHIHGETALVGSSQGEVVRKKYSPAMEVFVETFPGDKYHLHTHPPFIEPFTSSASARDHLIAAHMYLDFNNKMGTYVTNGKDVLHIQADSTELVKLVPDAEVEKTVGKFPEAYRVPAPQLPPYPFANHEAPGSLKPGRLKPKDSPEDRPDRSWV